MNKLVLCMCVLSVLASCGLAQTVDIQKEALREYKETQRIIAERVHWDIERVKREAITPESIATATYDSPTQISIMRTDALVNDLIEPNSAERTEWQTLKASLANQDSPEAYGQVAAFRRKIAFSNPLLSFDRIAFIKHNRMVRGESHMCDQYLGFNQAKGGGVFALEKPFSDTPTVTNILSKPVSKGRLSGRKLGNEGSFIALDVDFDASRLLFSYTEAEHGVPTDADWTNQPAGEQGIAGQPGHAKHYYWKKESAFHVFSVDHDGENLHQLTDTMWNDTDPCWLPNGRIVFISEDNVGQTRCSGRALPCGVLNSMMADGSDRIRLSYHETTEWHPSVDNSGMLVYTRWDYTDRENDAGHHPWRCYPDGRDPRAFHGNYPLPGRLRQLRPWMELSVRAVPDSPLYMATATQHHGEAYGSIVMINPRIKDDGMTSQLKRLTPEYRFPEAETASGKPGSHFGQRASGVTAEEAPFGTPWPLSEKYYLAVYTRAYGSKSFGVYHHRKAHADFLDSFSKEKETYGIYLCDIWGNRELLYRDDALSCLDPIPFAPRKRPPILHAQTLQAAADRAPGQAMPTTGEVAIMNVYDSSYPWPKDTKIDSLRVVAVFPKETFHENVPHIGIGNQSLARGVIGTAPVEADGSCYFTLPAGYEVYFQALDKDGLAIQGMKSGTYVHPGERLSCVGCHEDTATTAQSASNQSPIAFARAPSKLKPEAVGSYPLSFPRMIQPILDRKCISCHSPEGWAAREKEGEKPNRSIDLRGDVFVHRNWSKAYQTLTTGHATKNSMAYATCGRAGAMVSHCEPSTSTPGKIGARTTKLYPLLASGHGDLTPEELRAFACWLDCNSVFFGAYYQEKEQAKGAAIFSKFAKGIPLR